MKPYQYIPIFMLAFMATAALGQENNISPARYDGVMIYKLAWGEKINTLKLKLYPHHIPLKTDEKWTCAFIDVGYKLTNIILIEELPGKAKRVIYTKPFGESAYIILEGEGYTEIRSDPNIPGKGIYWKKGDAFTAPYGYWIGHANPYGQPARILRLGISLTNDLLNPEIEMKDNRPKLPYLLNLIPYEKDALAGGDIGKKPSGWLGDKIPEPDKKFEGFAIYKTRWGTKVNVDTIKTLQSVHAERKVEGWNSAHIELGGKILNWFVIQDLPPKATEIGHKHSGEAIFLVLKGSGTTTFRKSGTSPPTSTIDWSEGDIFCLPWMPEGTWHGHSNSNDDPSRILASVHKLKDDLLNPFKGQVKKIKIVD